MYIYKKKKEHISDAEESWSAKKWKNGKVKKKEKERAKCLKKTHYFIISLFLEINFCYILTFDPAQKCYSNVMHRKEVTHSKCQ